MVHTKRKNGIPSHAGVLLLACSILMNLPSISLANQLSPSEEESQGNTVEIPQARGTLGEHRDTDNPAHPLQVAPSLKPYALTSQPSAVIPESEMPLTVTFGQDSLQKMKGCWVSSEDRRGNRKFYIKPTGFGPGIGTMFDIPLRLCFSNEGGHWKVSYFRISKEGEVAEKVLDYKVDLTQAMFFPGHMLLKTEWHFRQDFGNSRFALIHGSSTISTTSMNDFIGANIAHFDAQIQSTAFCDNLPEINCKGHTWYYSWEYVVFRPTARHSEERGK